VLKDSILLLRYLNEKRPIAYCKVPKLRADNHCELDVMFILHLIKTKLASFCVHPQCINIPPLLLNSCSTRATVRPTGIQAASGFNTALCSLGRDRPVHILVEKIDTKRPLNQCFLNILSHCKR